MISSLALNPPAFRTISFVQNALVPCLDNSPKLQPLHTCSRCDIPTVLKTTLALSAPLRSCRRLQPSEPHSRVIDYGYNPFSPTLTARWKFY